MRLSPSPEGSPAKKTNVYVPFLRGQNLYTNTARRGPNNHLEGSLLYMYFLSFSVENKLFDIHQTSFAC